MEKLTPENLIKINKRVLLVKRKKADQHKIINYPGITYSAAAQETKQDPYINAKELMTRLADKNIHPFASGNKRTSLIAGVTYLTLNKKPIHHNVLQTDVGVLKGIREGYYKDVEVVEWLKTGKIRNFIR